MLRPLTYPFSLITQTRFSEHIRIDTDLNTDVVQVRLEIRDDGNIVREYVKCTRISGSTCISNGEMSFFNDYYFSSIALVSRKFKSF